MRSKVSSLIFLSCFLVCAVLLVDSARAQVSICQEELNQANAMYTAGRFDDAIERLDACLEKEGISEMESRTAFRLKGLSFIGKGLEVDAKAAVKRLLQLIPNYQPDPVQDPPDFVAMVNEMKDEINQTLANTENQAGEGEENENDAANEQPGGGTVTGQTPPPTTENPVVQPARKKKRTGRFILIGAGVAAAGGVVVALIGGGGGGGGTAIADPPQLPE